MPLAAKTEAVISAWIEKMSPGPVLQLQRSTVSPHVIAVLAKSRFTTVTKFHMIADDPAGVEKVAKILGLDDEASIDVLSRITWLKTAWAAMPEIPAS